IYQTLSGLPNGTRTVAAYIGIRYAEPPIGSLRYAAPIPLTTPWSGEYDATKAKYACSQYVNIFFPDSWVTSEDCLFLTIWQPLNATCLNQSSCPIVFFIHGS